MLLGIVIFFAGIWISFYPAEEAGMLVWMISLTLLFYGIYFVVISLQFSKKKAAFCDVCVALRCRKLSKCMGRGLAVLYPRGV